MITMDLTKYKDFIEKGMVYVATADRKAKPNLVCVMRCKLVSKDTICMTDVMMDKTKKNLLQNKQISLVVGRGDKWFQFKGAGSYQTAGKWFKFVKSIPGNKIYDVNAAVLVKVKEVYDLYEGERVD